jgi:hypothetical protein
MAKHYEHQLARSMRSEGVAITHIATRLSVSKGTVSRWVADIILTSDQEAALRVRKAGGHLNGAYANRDRAKAQRDVWRDEGRTAAEQSDPLHVMGCMLYWGEGAKARNRVAISNTDMVLLQVFLRFLQEHFIVDDEQIRLTVHYYHTPGLSEQDIKVHWGQHLELPVSCFTPKQSVDVRMRSRVNPSNKWPYGVCRLVVHSTRIAQHIYGAIEQYSGSKLPHANL